MRHVASEGNRHVLNLERGEELFSTLLPWCKEKDMYGATLTGLGAADELVVAYYNLKTKSYERHNIEEEVEILSLTGNLAQLEGNPVFHIHGVFGRNDLSTFGGHLFKLRVSGACEIHLVSFRAPFERRFDETTGLNLLCEI